jgi:hypothetical protein
MASLIVAGDTSGTVTLQAPAIAGSTVLTLPTTSGTIVTTGGGASVPFAAGSASSPSITFTGDTNTGIFSPGADTIAFSEGGVESMRIDSSGNVGIGLTNPGIYGQLEVGGSTNTTIALRSSSASGTIFALTTVGSTEARVNAISNVPMTFYTNNTERMRIDSSGNVGIGLTNPQGILDVAGRFMVQSNDGVADVFVSGTTNRDALIRFREVTTQRAYIQSTAGTSNLAFGVGTTERMRLNSDGGWFLGKTAPSSSVNGWELNTNGQGGTSFTMANTNEIFVWNNISTAGTAVIQFRVAGTAKGQISWNNTNTTYTTTSDYRLKENIAPMTGALAKVSALKPCTYTWKEGGQKSQGFIAHELAEVVSDCVTGEKDGTKLVDVKDEQGNVIGQEEVPVYQGIDTSFLVATLTAAIQEQQAIIQSQADKITAMEARLTALENK